MKASLIYEVNPVTCSGSSIPFLNLRHSHSIPIFLLLLMVVCGFAFAQVPNAKLSSCLLTDTEAAGLSGDTSIDIHAVSNYSKAITDLLKAEKFEQLDCLADSARSHKETFPGGMWKIHAIYSGLEKPPLHATQEDWDIHMESLQRWVSTRPESTTARIALAESYVSYGWDARGSGFADTVSESGWKLLAERTAKAKQVLEQASVLSAKDPEWYVAMQQVALGQSWEPDATQALLEQAIKFEPAYYYYYRMYADSILPKWGGEQGETERFMQESADHIGGDAGDILYFRVAGTLFCGCQDDQQLKLSWPRIQKGFAAVEKQNGPSPENWNLFAHLAVHYGDALVADKMLAKIGDQWSEDVWHTSSSFESAKQWAKEVVPMMAKRHDAEEFVETSLRTSEGKKYNAAFAEKIRTWIQSCLAEGGGNDLGDFELLLKIGKEGKVEDLTGGGTISPLTQCLAHMVSDFKVSKHVVFAPPPQADYWVRFDFIPEHPASTALK